MLLAFQMRLITIILEINDGPLSLEEVSSDHKWQEYRICGRAGREESCGDHTYLGSKEYAQLAHHSPKIPGRYIIALSYSNFRIL